MFVVAFLWGKTFKSTVGGKINMNSLMKILVLSTLLIFIMSSASAVFQDLNVWDQNNSRHANKGEDFNIIMETPMISDINSDFNYLFAFSYTDSRGTLYLDLNVNATHDANGIDINGDGNVFVRTMISDANTPCYGAGDVNILVLSDQGAGGRDFNIFNLQITVPTTDGANNTGISSFVGKPVLIEMWKIEDVSLGVTAQCVAKVADGNFIVGPAILAYSNQITTDQVPATEVALINQEITIFGFGFGPSLTWEGESADNNVTISIWDANGTALNAVTRIIDLNIAKAYRSKSVSLLGIFHRLRADLDTNGQVRSMVGTTDGISWAYADWNGITVYPDTNGEFDVNFFIPYVTNQAGSTIGRADLNTLRASSAIDGDVNAIFVIAPKISLADDMNAVVTIDGTVYDLNVAILNRTITNIQAVSNLIIKMGSIINGNSTIREIKVAFNTDTNFGITPILNMGTDFNGRSGYVDLDANTLANGGIDANITMYDVNIGSSTIPFILKNSQPCAATVCTNPDGRGRTPAAWSYETAAGDGNLAFRVSTFSIYEASPFDITMTAPLGGEKIRTPRHGVDANYQIEFSFTDLNRADNAAGYILPLKGVITYATKRGANTGVIIYDTNIFDTIGIRCNEWEDITPDKNLSAGVDCVFDWNRSDLNSGIVGEFVIDVNIASGGGQRSVLTGTDSNVFINPPLIEITDVEINDGNATINSTRADVNYVVDFNIYLPDIDRDQNFTLADYNIHFYLSPTQSGIGFDDDGVMAGGVSDLNVLGVSQVMDQNFFVVGNGWDTNAASNGKGINMRCVVPPVTAPYLDYKCTLQYDTNGVFEIKNYITVKLVSNFARTTSYTTVNNGGAATVVTHVVDVNELWDTNASVYMFSINDNNVPRATLGTSGDYDPASIVVSGTSYIATIICDDNTSGPAEYYYKLSSVTAWSTITGVTNQFTINSPTPDKTTTVTYNSGCKDHADNTSDINGTITVELRPAGSRTSPDTRSPSGGISPVVTVGTETILVVEIQGTAPVENIIETLTEAGFTEEEIATATIVAENTPVDQKVVVDKITNETGSSYQTWVSLKVTNTSNKKWKNVKVIVEIPKGIASNASQISSEFAMVVLKADPIIEFTIPEIQVGETAEIKYSTDKQISDVTARLLPLGMVIAYTEVAPCDGVSCETQICATGGCNSATGLCEYDYYADETSCGDNKWCQSGACTEKPEPSVVTPPPVTPPVDYTLPIVAAIIIIIVIGAAAYYTKTKKGKGQ